MSIFNKQKKSKEPIKRLTLQEKWALDAESYKKNGGMKVQNSQCYGCANNPKWKEFKCDKMDKIPSNVLLGKKKCKFREEKN